MCLVAFQKMFRKIFSNVWLCSWKYHRKHIFYLLLTFSRLPNKYIISFIPQNTNKTQKKIIKSGQTKVRSRLARSRLQSMHLTIAIDAFAVPMMSALRRPRCRWCRRTARCRWCHDLFFLSLSLFYFPRPEVIWSENGNRNDFPLFWLWNSVNWKCFSVWPNLK